MFLGLDCADNLSAPAYHRRGFEFYGSGLVYHRLVTVTPRPTRSGPLTSRSPAAQGRASESSRVAPSGSLFTYSRLPRGFRDLAFFGLVRRSGGFAALA